MSDETIPAASAEPTEPTPTVAEPAAAAAPPPPPVSPPPHPPSTPPPPRPAWGPWSRPRQRWLPLLIIGLVGILLGCLVGGMIGFVAGHVVTRDRPGHHWQGPGYDRRYGGPGFVRPGGRLPMPPARTAAPAPSAS